MIALYILACLALASAAPRLHFSFNENTEHRPFMRPPPPHDHGHNSDFFTGSYFDTTRFWNEMSVQMQKFDEMIKEFETHFPSSSSPAIQGNEYVVIVNLNGFDEKDVKVKAKEGVLMVQAVHKSDDGSERSYLDLKTLPSYVNVNGTWTFEMGVLKITFPLNSKPEVATEAAVEEETQGPNNENRDREEMDSSQNENDDHDADVGVERGDRDTEILTNAIPSATSVEATTYAVDLQNEVEFVPVKY